MPFFAALIGIELNESRVDNYAFPRVFAFKLVDLNTNTRVLSHNIQLLTRQSKCI